MRQNDRQSSASTATIGGPHGEVLPHLQLDGATPMGDRVALHGVHEPSLAAPGLVVRHFEARAMEGAAELRSQALLRIEEHSDLHRSRRALVERGERVHREDHRRRGASHRHVHRRVIRPIEA